MQMKQFFHHHSLIAYLSIELFKGNKNVLVVNIFITCCHPIFKKIPSGRIKNIQIRLFFLKMSFWNFCLQFISIIQVRYFYSRVKYYICLLQINRKGSLNSFLDFPSPLNSFCSKIYKTAKNCSFYLHLKTSLSILNVTKKGMVHAFLLLFIQCEKLNQYTRNMTQYSRYQC